MKVELIYFDGCPNVERARQNIRKAFIAAGIEVQWTEWNQKDKTAPDYVRQYGSPSILINGRDIIGAPDDCGTPDSCRIYEGGAPSPELIKAALDKGARLWFLTIPSFLAAGAAALPVLTCPFCWPLYAGLLSAAGLGFVDYTPYLFPATALLLITSLLSLGWRAKARWGYFPLAGGTVASLLILSGKFYLDKPWIFYAGIALLLLVSIWNIWPKNKSCQASFEKA